MSHKEPTELDILDEGQSPRNIRIQDQRNALILDQGFVASGDYASIDMLATATGVKPGGVVAGPAIDVRVYDTVMLFIDHVVGEDETELRIGVQSTYVEKPASDAQWYERATSHELRYGDVSAISLSNELIFDTSGYSKGNLVKLATEIEALGHCMRFTPWLKADDAENSRCVIRGIRRAAGT